jgi:hypothetical protein
MKITTKSLKNVVEYSVMTITIEITFIKQLRANSISGLPGDVQFVTRLPRETIRIIIL